MMTGEQTILFCSLANDNSDTSRSSSIDRHRKHGPARVRGGSLTVDLPERLRREGAQRAGRRPCRGQQHVARIDLLI